MVDFDEGSDIFQMVSFLCIHIFNVTDITFYMAVTYSQYRVELKIGLIEKTIVYKNDFFINLVPYKAPSDSGGLPMIKRSKIIQKHDNRNCL